MPNHAYRYLQCINTSCILFLSSPIILQFKVLHVPSTVVPKTVVWNLRVVVRTPPASTFSVT